MMNAAEVISLSRIALVHDYFVQMGGAERVAEAIHDSFPSSPIYTTVALQRTLSKRLRAADIRTSPMQHLPAKACDPTDPSEPRQTEWNASAIKSGGIDAIISAISLSGRPSKSCGGAGRIP